MGDKRLSEVLNYQRDIEPYRFIKIYSGVGSGKSTFACRFITGCEEKGQEMPELTTLIITSRRATVEETLRKMGRQIQRVIGARGNLNSAVYETGEERPFEYEKYVRLIFSEDEFCDESLVHNQSTVCTNAYIEYHLKQHYIPSDPTTHLWNLFDVIVVDEVHSLITDATYQSAPFAVMEMMKEYLRKCANGEKMLCKHLIVMSGSPAPFENYAGLSVSPENSRTYSVFDECVNVTPDTVKVLDAYSAKQNLQGILCYMKNKAVYFSNHTLDEAATRKKWELDLSVEIAVSYSKEEKRNSLPEKEQKQMERVEAALETGFLPDDVDLFVTTSRNKEGINILNDDIKEMFVESHFSSDIIQMAGRVRNGLDSLFIVADAKQFCIGIDELAVEFTSDRIVRRMEDHELSESQDGANQFLSALCKRHGIKDILHNKECKWNIHQKAKDTIGKYICYVEDRFPYVRYSYIDNSFKFYQQKYDAELMIHDEIERFNAAIFKGDSATEELIREWYPNAKVLVDVGRREKAIALIEHYLDGENFVELTEREFQRLFENLKKVLHVEGKYPNPFLVKLGGYGISNPIKNASIGKLGNRFLYKGQDPLTAIFRKRSAFKKSKNRKKQK